MKKPILLVAHLLAHHTDLWAVLGLLAVLAFRPQLTRAAVVEAWTHRYDGPANSNDVAKAVAVDGSGNVVVTGTSYNGTNGHNDYYTAKYAAADGALFWEQRYNGPGNANDYANALAVDSSFNVVVTGSSATIKYLADGTAVWTNNDHGIALVLDGSGNVVVTGGSGTIKYAAADGALLWDQRCRCGDERRAVAMDSTGNVVITGYSYNSIGGADYYTAKYAAADGALLWEQFYNGGYGDDVAQAVTVDGSGSVIVTGVSTTGRSENDDPIYGYYTAKYAAGNGALLWEKLYDGPYGLAQAVAVDGSGNVMVTGSSGTIKYLADGTEVWTNNGPTSGNDPQAVAVDGSGNVVVTGYSYNTHGNTDYYTAKYAAADGALLWEKRYNGPANGSDYASSLAVGLNGMVAVTGSSSGDYATVVYRDDVYPISIAIVPAGVRLRFTGIPGRTYNIERASAATGPWSTLATPTASASGPIEYLDTSPPIGSAFYRTVAPSE